MIYVIELVGLGRKTFVESYSNLHGGPVKCHVAGQAKQFSSETEAISWAQHYLPGYNYKITLTA